MSLASLYVKNVRNLAETHIEPAPCLNIFHGANASGKTSLLEAVYLLGRARSFRSSYIQNVISKGTDSFTVVGQVNVGADQRIPLGIEYAAEKMRMRAAGQTLERTSDLVTHLPLLLINPDSHKILTLGPRQRRRFMDWGVFHVEHTFMPIWTRYCRAIKQRNAALRCSGRSMPEDVWSLELQESAGRIDLLRREYLRDYLPLFVGFVEKLLPLEGVSLRYLRGWAQDTEYREVLARSLEKDRSLGHTSRGPHRADVMIEVAGKPAQEYTSGGQQKLLICAMYLAQAALLKARAQRQCIILVDDLPAELDTQHRRKLIDLLCGLDAQIMVTTTDRGLIHVPEMVERKMFHVEHGVVTEQAF